MMHCIIVDDELKSRETLKKMISTFCEGVEIDAVCQNVTEGVAAINTHKPNIVFLDIQMQRETGFDLLTKFKTIDFEIVFTTAHAEYALKAIKFAAIDYLLKPIDSEDLKLAIEKVERKQNGSMTERLLQLVQNLKGGTTENYKLALPTSEGLAFIKVMEIMYCMASGNYTEIFMIDGKKHLVSRTLKEYDDLLIDHNFFRIHNSYLINLNCIKNYVKGEGGYVVMNDGVSVDVSRRKKEAFLDRIGYNSIVTR